jgi:hypothetical protein
MKNQFEEMFFETHCFTEYDCDLMKTTNGKVLKCNIWQSTIKKNSSVV